MKEGGVGGSGGKVIGVKDGRNGEGGGKVGGGAGGGAVE